MRPDALTEMAFEDRADANDALWPKAQIQTPAHRSRAVNLALRCHEKAGLGCENSSAITFHD
ncbi:hypothetical protein AM571_PC00951 (plasmid) [Rhizobium etli 8C-3]|uniref:Uncharacterized protein n=1 Tax=Rhizobium etli 8C-3 TaxID=538025 RepID=A0A1L5PER9_RHIET|nr:hypothetical protein AM571_PC00951 [Rhizobium etli 8C-3]